uniref:Uncharacterized protein n=1 Tax=Oryza rufipogon TaxID=4529 RepID=A0A0E0PZ51_ORYRU
MGHAVLPQPNPSPHSLPSLAFLFSAEIASVPRGKRRFAIGKGEGCAAVELVEASHADVVEFIISRSTSTARSQDLARHRGIMGAAFDSDKDDRKAERNGQPWACSTTRRTGQAMGALQIRRRCLG